MESEIPLPRSVSLQKQFPECSGSNLSESSKKVKWCKGKEDSKICNNLIYLTTKRDLSLF